MLQRWAMRLFVALSAIVVAGGLIYVYAFPPEETRLDRHGIPYHTPPVIHPKTGEPIPLDVLVRHYRGERP
jgi:hypothetical protein